MGTAFLLVIPKQVEGRILGSTWITLFALSTAHYYYWLWNCICDNDSLSENISKIKWQISGGKELKYVAKVLQSPKEKGRLRACVVLSLVLTYQAARQEDVLWKYLQ